MMTQSLKVADVTVKGFVTRTSSQVFLVGEYLDEYKTLAVSFLTRKGDEYVVIDIPKQFSPSSWLMHQLWMLFDNGKYPPIAVPGGGYYYGSEFHTVRAAEFEENKIIAGNKVLELTHKGVETVEFITSEYGDTKVAYFGIYAGSTETETLWRPIPTPLWVLGDSDTMDHLYCILEDAGATLLEFTDTYQ